MTDQVGNDKKVELPLSMWVKGGTPTAASTERLEREYQASERDRRIADAERALSQIPIEQGGAMMHEHRFGAEDADTWVHVFYCNRAGSQRYTPSGGVMDGCANLTVGTASDPLELVLQVICPQCAATLPHMQECHMQIRQSNKAFEFKPHVGKFFIHDDGNGPRRYRSAGVVVASEKFTCPRCTYTARFDKNRLIED